MVFWVYLGSQSYLRGEEGRGREREEMALPLSCMRYFDPATGEFFRALAVALTGECPV